MNKQIEVWFQKQALFCGTHIFECMLLLLLLLLLSRFSCVRLLATHGLQPTRVLRPWDFPGKSTGVGCHCLLNAYSLLSLVQGLLGYWCLFNFIAVLTKAP